MSRRPALRGDRVRRPAKRGGPKNTVSLNEPGGSQMPVTYYVALPFIRTDEDIAAGQGQECPTEPSAIRKAEAMSRDAANIEALAFKRAGDPNIGSYCDATILKTFRDIPENLDELCIHAL